MFRSRLSQEEVERVKAFHGHWCPGLAIGIRVAEVALSEVGSAADEEVVAVVETDMCGVDAIQFLTGCTFGKGNLIHRDYGKNAFTFYRRSDSRAVRIAIRPEAFGEPHAALSALRKRAEKEGGLTPQEEEELRSLYAAVTEHIMTEDPEVLFDVQPASGPIPKKARILEGLVCEGCGERTMETRTRRFKGQTLCIPCFERLETR